MRSLLAVFALSVCFAPSFAQTAATPQVGASAPDFALNTPEGKPVRLSTLEKSGPVILVLLRGYPGYQCPFCQRQVHDFVETASKFAANHAQVLLVYPGPPADLDAHAKEFLAKQDATLPPNLHLVVDPDYTMTNQYGLRWDKPHETAYPTTFILSRAGLVVFRKVSHEHGDRTAAADLLPQLANLK